MCAGGYLGNLDGQRRCEPRNLHRRAQLGSISQSGTFGNGVTAIDNIRVFNANAGGGGQFNLFANHITVAPEPATARLGSLGLLSLLRRRK